MKDLKKQIEKIFDNTGAEESVIPKLLTLFEEEQEVAYENEFAKLKYWRDDFCRPRINQSLSTFKKDLIKKIENTWEAIDKAPRHLVKGLEEHEFIDTCVVYKTFHKIIKVIKPIVNTLIHHPLLPNYIYQNKS